MQAQRLNGVAETAIHDYRPSRGCQFMPARLPAPCSSDQHLQCSERLIAYHLPDQSQPARALHHADRRQPRTAARPASEPSPSPTSTRADSINSSWRTPTPPEADGARPLIAQYGNDNLYQYNSEAIFKQNQFITNVQIRLSQRLSLMGFYALGYANSDTGGPSSNPSNSYDLTQDYGRASFDVRNRLFLAGTASLAHNIRISPFVIANSGAPFNITTGHDNNGDSFFNDRPSFATRSPATPTSAPPRTAASEPHSDAAASASFPSITAKARPTSRSICVSPKPSASVRRRRNSSCSSGSGPRRQRRGGGGHGGLRAAALAVARGMGSIFGPSNTTRRYNLTLTATARNLFNTWNPGSPIGNLSSTMFGKSNSLAGGPFSSGTANRRVDFQALFSF